MIFLDPKTDIAFKKLFGDITHKNVLISFLNNVLEKIEGRMIIDVTITDPTNTPETPLSKLSISLPGEALREAWVDVKCTDQSNNQYIVEMQVSTQKDYTARAQYYSSLALSRQLSSGEKYAKLVPVIFIGILDFELLQNPDYISHHLILDKKTHIQELCHLEFHFIELSKFNKNENELSNVLDKWIFLLKNASILQKVPNSFKEPAFAEAFGILEQGNWSRKELDAYEKYIDAVRCEMSRMDTALDKGIELSKIAIAKNLLDILDIETIAKKTGLSIEQVKKFKN